MANMCNQDLRHTFHHTTCRYLLFRSQRAENKKPTCSGRGGRRGGERGQMFPQVQTNGANLGRRAIKTTGSSECSPHFDPELLPGGEHAVIWTLQQHTPSFGATATLTAAVLHRPVKMDCGCSLLRTGVGEAASSSSSQIKPLPPEPGRK